MRTFSSRSFRLLAAPVLIAGVTAASGCVSDYSFSKTAPDKFAALENPNPTGAPAGPVTSSPPVPAPVSITLKAIKPAFAVRGLNCMACHGIFGSNVITDFGYGSTNFNLPVSSNFPAPTFFSGMQAFGNNRNAWQTAKINNGSLIIPHAAVAAADSKNMFGILKDLTLEELVQMGGLDGNALPMSANITPAPGKAPVVEKGSIKISYPSQAEILALAPQLAGNGFAAIQAPGITQISQVSGFAVDASGGFVRNQDGQNVVCKGDVVVRGPLFLKNLQLSTDAHGCRLYVAGTVFIQGPINYVDANSASDNLQITSSSAILMGFSTKQMGAAAQGSGQVRVAGAGDNRITNPGGNFARFAQVYDLQYDPSGAPINGVDRKTFFDTVVADGLKIGAELLDAGDAGAKANPPAGCSVTDPAQDEGGRLSIDYRGLLLNAPNVHSRYAGSFRGVVIADVAMLARNPDSVTIEQYLYDRIFDSVDTVLPALTTSILEVK